MLEGKDIVARARTGSGKTLAYLLPALHKVLTAGRGRAGWQALVLVPTQELCEQASSLSLERFLYVMQQQLGSSYRDIVRALSWQVAAWPGRLQRALRRQICL